MLSERYLLRNFQDWIILTKQQDKVQIFQKCFQNVQLFSINPIKYLNVYADSYNQFHNILRLFDVLPNFPFSTSETMCDYTHKHGIYELSQELPNDLRLRIRKLGNIRKLSKSHSTQSSCQNQHFLNTRKKLFKSRILNFYHRALFHVKTRVSLKYFVNDCRLTQICRAQWWCSLLLFLNRNVLFRQI